MARVRAATVLLAIVILAVLSPAVAADSQPTATSTPAASNATNGSVPTPPTNGTAPPRPPGGWGSGGLFKSTEERAKDFAAGIANFTVSDASNGTATVIDGFTAEMLTLPAPGQFDAPRTWLAPGNGMWPSVMTLYQALYGLVAIPMLAGGAWYVFAADPHDRRSEARRYGKNVALLVGGLLIVPTALHAGNIIAMGFAPSGREFLATPGNIGRLGAGIIVGGGLLLLKAAVVLAAVVVLYIQDLLVYISVATYPAAIWLLSTRNTFAQALGAGLLGMLSFLIFLKALQAVVLRFLFELPLGFSDAAAIATSAEVLVVTIVGVAIVFVVVPIYGTKKAIPAAVHSIGGKVRTDGKDWIDEHREDLPGREQLVESVHGASPMHSRRAEPAGGAGGTASASASASATSEPSTRRVGSLQQRTASHSRPGGRPGAATRSTASTTQAERARTLGNHRAAEGAASDGTTRAAADDD